MDYDTTILSDMLDKAEAVGETMVRSPALVFGESLDTTDRLTDSELFFFHMAERAAKKSMRRTPRGYHSRDLVESAVIALAKTTIRAAERVEQQRFQQLYTDFNKEHYLRLDEPITWAQQSSYAFTASNEVRLSAGLLLTGLHDDGALSPTLSMLYDMYGDVLYGGTVPSRALRRMTALHNDTRLLLVSHVLSSMYDAFAGMEYDRDVPLNWQLPLALSVFHDRLGDHERFHAANMVVLHRHKVV